MHDIMRAVKPCVLDGTHYVMHKYLIHRIFNNNLRYAITSDFLALKFNEKNSLVGTFNTIYW